ncbi:hypothetical protein K1T35_47650 (plasmid) [Pseudonocardia sp. DSM 110487]|uniref:hypothetical protein n=1 Tax=Pseudonocardia sp. DSM 110487 TaxID=2865833 RepID=UPI001C6A0A8B|nr:hypothetical protein [Pseudonocardia sp. DSM 110487]QYN41026.1 hypothetical protein K1T35_47650 [Pseudonocardia sp. DSM 110487]
MAGGYCAYCDQRCFVYRDLPDGTWSGHMATCPRGMAHDRQVTGYDYRTAVNPIARTDEPARPAADPGPFLAPFRQLIHNIHQFGRRWSWRCGVSASTRDEHCRYDRTVGSWEQLVDAAVEHLQTHHNIHLVPPGALGSDTDVPPAGRRDAETEAERRA